MKEQTIAASRLAILLLAGLSVACLGAAPSAHAQSATHAAAKRVVLGNPLEVPLALSADARTSRVLAALRAKAQQAGTTRVIVGVRVPFAPEGFVLPASAAQQRSEIAALQSIVLDRIPSLRARPQAIKRFESIPFMALEVDIAELEALAALTEITSIEEDRLVAPTLAQSSPLIGATTAWPTSSGLGWAVAVLDTGVEGTHSFLAGKVVSEACYSTNSAPQGASTVCPGGATSSTAAGAAMPYGGACPAGECDHGTHVAGIATGTSVSFSGVGKDASLIAVQVFTKFNNVSLCGSAAPCVLSFNSDQILGLQRVFALRNTFQIAAVNMSLGGGRNFDESSCDADNASIKAAIDNLRSAKIATVISSGNSAYSDSMGAPGCISSAVSVGSTWDQGFPGFSYGFSSCTDNSPTVDRVACYSNSVSFLHLLAPGSEITSSIPGNAFSNYHGTSMASPQVAGAWAVMRQKYPNASVDEALSALKATGTNVTDARNAIVKPRIAIDRALASSFAFSAASQSVSETAANAQVTVVRGSSSLSIPTSVTVQTTAGTAIAGTDYTSTTTVLSWTAGDIASKSFNVPLLHNPLATGDRTFTVSFSSPTPGVLVDLPSTQTVTIVDRSSQAISFTSTAPTSAVFGGATYAVTATATSGLAVAFTIDASAGAVCSIAGSTVSFTGVGTCVIDADQAGNASFNPALQVQQSFAVGKASQTIGFTSTVPSAATVGGATYTVTATATSGLAVAFTIDPSASTVCSIAGATVSFAGSGTCVINANQAGNANYNAAPQAQQSFAVGKASQTVGFTSTPPVSAVVGGPSDTVTATATSGLAVAFTIDPSASSVCSIAGATVSFTGVGTCVINANQAGNASYNPAPQVQQSFAVGKASQTIGFTSTAPVSAAVGGPTYTVTATATSGLAVSFTIDASASAVCSIAGATVSFTAAGTCVINANQAGNANYNAAPQAQQSFAVGKASQTIGFTSTAPSGAIVGGATYTVTATATSGLAVSFAIDASASAVCSIAGATVSITGAGTCVINANQAGNANYNAAPQAQQSFAVGKASQTIGFTSTAPSAATVGGATYMVTATATSVLAVTFTIDASASAVCSIAGATVSFTGSGTCVINANQAGNANYNAAPQAQQSFAVGKASQTIGFTSTAPSAATVGGATYGVTATATSGLAVSFAIDASASTVCSIVGSTVSFSGAGTCVINANQAGNANYNPAPQAQQSFAVGKASQTIGFTSTAPSAATVGGATYGVSATATSGLAVSFAIDPSAGAVCSIAGSTVSFTAAGTCVINANQAGNANYNAAPQVQQSFGVGKASQTIGFTSTAPTSAVIGGATYTVTATATSGLAVTFTIDASASAVCSIAGSTVSFAGAGACVINANQAGNANYNAAPQTQQSFAVGKASQTISFTSTAPVSATVGGATYAVAATATSGLAVTFAIDASANSVCSIAGSTVSFIGAGSCVINANQPGNGNYNAAPQAQQSFAVGKASQTIGFMSTAPSAATVGGATYTVTATATSGLAVAFTIDASASAVCSIAGATVSFTGVGTCVINANQAGNANYNAAPQAQQSFAVGKASQTIGFTSTAPISATVGGATYAVTATATSGLAVSFTIDASAIAVCSIAGSTVSFTSAGTCVINANQSGNANYNAAPQVPQSFGVGKASQTIGFTSTAPASAVIGGSTYAVSATATSGLAVAFTIDASASGVCSIAGATVSFTGAGTCVINASQAGNANYNAAPQAQQSFAVGKASQTIGFTSTASASAVIGSATYTVTATATSGLAVTFTIDTSASGVCSIAGSTVSFTGAGTCVIDANQTGNSNYNAAPQVQQSFAVGKASQTIGFTSTTPVSATVGGPTYAVTATASSGLAVSFTIDASASTVCSIAGSTVSFTGAGTCVINANQAGNANYSAAPQAQQSFAVGKASQTINFTSTPPSAATVGGSTYTVMATATSGLAVSFAIDASAGAVCSIAGSTVSFTSAGTCVINANQGGNANYSAATQASQSFPVSAAGAIALSRGSLDFGGQSMRTTSPAQSITLTNTGGTAVTVSSIAASTHFAVTHDCGTLPAAINAGASCTASITFTPMAQGPLGGTLTVTGTAEAQAAALAGTGERSLVTHYYRSILRRAPDAGGKSFWESEATRLAGLGANVNETWYAMSAFFYTSAEYLALHRDNAGFVTDLYNTFFNRAPDAGGLAYWVQQLDSGNPREVILASFMFSGEFAAFTQAIFGDTAARAEVDMAGDFFRGLLARLPDDGGLAFWVGRFRTAQCQGAGAVNAQVESISNSFVASAEYVNRSRTNSQYVGDLYNAFLRRGGDLVGVDFWIDTLDTAALTRSQVRQNFIASDEFQARVNAVIAQGCPP